MTSARRAPLTGLLVLLFGLLLLSCEDPSGVGLTVVDFGETDPRAEVVAVEAELDTLVDATGALRPTSGQFIARFLAGRAEDPYFGTIEADGYLGLLTPGSVPVGYATGTVDEAILELYADYVFGDTAFPAVFDLFEIDESWNALTFSSDSTLQLGDEAITSFEISAADTLVAVHLPEDWVAARDSLLRSQGFGEEFHGFAVRARAHNQMAVGFTAQSRLLGIRHLETENGQVLEADTVTYPSLQLASTIDRDLGSANSPQELYPLQDGAGDGLYLNVRLDTLDVGAIAGGFVRIQADTLLLEQGIPGGFERPLARTLALYGIQDGPPVVVAEATLDRATSSYTFSSDQLNVVLQEMLLDRSLFERFAIGFLTRPSSISVAPLVQHAEHPPRIVLIVSPTE